MIEKTDGSAEFMLNRTQLNLLLLLLSSSSSLSSS